MSMGGLIGASWREQLLLGGSFQKQHCCDEETRVGVGWDQVLPPIYTIYHLPPVTFSPPPPSEPSCALLPSCQ